MAAELKGTMERMGTLMNTSQLRANQSEMHRLYYMLHGATEHPYRSKCGDFVCIFPQASGGGKRPLVSRWKEKAGFEVGIGVRKWVTGLLREDGYAGDLSEQTSRGRSERTDRASLLVLDHFASPQARPGMAVPFRWGNFQEKARNGEDERRQSWK